MSEAQAVGGLSGQLPNLPAMLKVIKEQEKARRIVAVVTLLTSAVLAILVGAITAIVFAVFVIAAIDLVPPVRKRILGDRLVLKDAVGRIRLVLDVHDEYAYLAMLDKQQGARLVASAGLNDNVTLAMFDVANKLRSTLSCTGDGSPGLVFYDETQQPRFLSVHTAGASMLQMYDQASEPQVDRMRDLRVELAAKPSNSTLYIKYDEGSFAAGANSEGIHVGGRDNDGVLHLPRDPAPDHAQRRTSEDVLTMSDDGPVIE